MRRVVLLLGGNIGDTRSHFAVARGLIEQRVGEIEQHSSEVSTEPWGFESDVLFWNQAIEVATFLEAEELLQVTQGIELEVGRDRASEVAERQSTQQRYASRVIDIDIITFGDDVVDLPQLKIPHALMSQREFVLEPMSEICAQWRHPLTHKSVEEMLRELRINKI